MARIAVVDDEKNIREVIRIALEKEFYQVEEYGDGLAAWEALQRTLAAGAAAPPAGTVPAADPPPDLFILDITMPRMDGIELCKKIRRISAAPVIFLSSRDEEIDKVLGLESGADDYVCKPFSLRELLARIRAGLRRTAAGHFAGPGPPESAAKSAGGLLLDEQRITVLWKEKALDCTVTEFRILQTLVSPPGIIKTREQIMAAAFPEDIYPNDRAADSHIKRIRKKFLELDGDFSSLEAVYGLGYKWKEP
ncbi:MAG: response regulator transcription factor [Spirochaetaceae bacterium]|jgi:two-component system response regulator ChvI|nr:response regulator transcription factor [Spirochaetaceae bacterium]